MSLLSRQSVVVSVGGIVCAGCAGSEESGPAFEYEISGFQGANEVPDGVVEHPNPDGFQCVAVTVDVTEGEIPGGDLYGFTQLSVGEYSEPTRAVGTDPREVSYVRPSQFGPSLAVSHDKFEWL